MQRFRAPKPPREIVRFDDVHGRELRAENVELTKSGTEPLDRCPFPVFLSSTFSLV
jgi:hypothetical protein